MTKILLALVAIPFFSVSALAECHTFTSPDGETMLIDGKVAKALDAEDDWSIRMPECSVLECYAPDGVETPMVMVKERTDKSATVRLDGEDGFRVWQASCK